VKWAQWDKTQSRELLVCSCVYASHCAQLLHTILHRTDLIVFPLALQTITTAPMMSIWGKGASHSAVEHATIRPLRPAECSSSRRINDLHSWSGRRRRYPPHVSSRQSPHPSNAHRDCASPVHIRHHNGCQSTRHVTNSSHVTSSLCDELTERFLLDTWHILSWLYDVWFVIVFQAWFHYELELF